MENTALTFEHIWALFMENRQQLAETRAQMAENAKQAAERAAEADRRLAENAKQMAETDKRLDNLAKQVGKITDTLGNFAEHQVRPKVLQLFKEQGIYLDEIYPNIVVKKDDVFIMEIDILLVNTIYSVAVEVKNTLQQKDVEEHIRRLGKLQDFSHRLLKGTTLYGAVAGMIVAQEVVDFAIANGLYVIVPSGENVEIANKASFEPRKWEVKGQ
jgi:hypothetical protein